MHRSISGIFLFFFLSLAAQSATPVNNYVSLIRTAELTGDREQVATQCRAWYASGQYSSGTLNWNYNALMSLEPDALLLTQNDNDTYPVWMLQYALGVRPDVRVLNLNLLENDAYRNLVIRQENLDYIPTGTTLSEFLRLFVSGKNTVPTYFGVMLDKNRIETAKNNLYLTGLALKYSLRPFDNVAVLRNNYENQFRLDYLKLEMTPEADPEILAQLNLNYLPAFLLLYKHYTTAGESGKAGQLRQLILNIGKAGHREAEVHAFLENTNTKQVFISDITPKTLEKSMRKVSRRIWAAETETTNAQYERFLQDLLKNRDFEQLELCKTTAVNWHSLLPDSLKNLPNAAIFPNGHPDNPEMPVQNITHEAAQRYCEWMTRVYNASTERKKFKKVLFRLPTEPEWIMAASGGKADQPYPWGGYYIRNSKGCYLCNMAVKEPCGGDCASKGQPDHDGGFFPVAAETYFPNDYGLYNISGNVAEMIDIQGKSKGGSWNDIPLYGQLKTVGEYKEPSPAVGFRVFMEIIEE